MELGDITAACFNVMEYVLQYVHNLVNQGKSGLDFAPLVRVGVRRIP